MYTLNIKYKSDFIGEDIEGNQQVYIEGFASNNEESFEPETLFLKKNSTEAKNRFWMMPLADIDEYGFSIYLNSVEGETTIESIEIKEYSLWRVGIWLLLLFFIIVFNLLVWVKYNLNSEQKLVIMALAVLVLYSSLPALGSEFYGGHDVGFHMSRIKNMADELSYGNFPVRFQHDAYNGCGNIGYIMYPNVFLYIPSCLHILGMPLDICYNTYIVLVNILTSLLCYYSFNKLFHRRTYALLGTTVYMLAAYRLCNIYIRFAVGEYTAMAFFPLVVYGLIRIYYDSKEEGLGECLPLIVGVTGIIQSHVLSCEIMAVFLILWALLHFRKSVKLIKKILLSVISTFGINCFFLIPFLEMYFTDLLIKTDNPKKPVGHGISMSQIFGIFQTYSGGSVFESSKGEMPLILGGSILIGILLFVICLIKRNDWNLQDETEFKAYSVLFGFGILSMWISSEFFPWRVLTNSTNIFAKLFVAIEFPWRYLAFGTLFFCIVLVYAVDILERNILEVAKRELLRVLIVVVAFLVVGDFYRGYINGKDPQSIGYVMTDCAADIMYNLTNFVEVDAAEFTKDMVVQHKDVIFHDINLVDDKKYYTLTNDKAAVEISFPMQAYKYVYAKDVETNTQFTTEMDEGGKLRVTIPAGYDGTMEVGFEQPILWRIVEVISLLCAIGVVIWWLIISYNKEYRQNERKGRS